MVGLGLCSLWDYAIQSHAAVVAYVVVVRHVCVCCCRWPEHWLHTADCRQSCWTCGVREGACEGWRSTKPSRGVRARLVGALVVVDAVGTFVQAIYRTQSGVSDMPVACVLVACICVGVCVGVSET